MTRRYANPYAQALAPAHLAARRERRERSRKMLPAAGRPIRMWAAILRNGLGVMRCSLEAGLCRNNLLAVCRGRRGCRREVPERVYAALVRMEARLADLPDPVRTAGDLMLPASAAEARFCRARSEQLRRAAGKDTWSPPAVVHVAPADYWSEDLRLWRPRAADAERRSVEMLTSKVWTALGMDRNPWRSPAGKHEVYMNAPMRLCAEAIEQAARDQEFLAVVGAVGSGKTTVLRYALEPLAASPQYAIAHVMCLGRERTNARVILEAMSRDLEGEDAPMCRSLERLTRQVCGHVQGLLRRNVAPVLVIDEAQALAPQALAPLKRIRELAAVGYSSGCAVILVGQTHAQPDLRSKLALPTVQEVARRVTVHELPGLGDSIPEYLRWRFRLAGAGNRRVVEEEALSALVEHFRGGSRAGGAGGAGDEEDWSVGPQELEQILTPAMVLAVRAGEGRVTVKTLSKVLVNFREPPAARSAVGGGAA